MAVEKHSTPPGAGLGVAFVGDVTHEFPSFTKEAGAARGVRGRAPHSGAVAAPRGAAAATGQSAPAETHVPEGIRRAGPRCRYRVVNYLSRGDAVGWRKSTRRAIFSSQEEEALRVRSRFELESDEQTGPP